jgi:3-(3-hydroxy-phenyl)propionate hydroxylase
MPSSPTCPVIVIGAGPTGLTLANLLGMAGIRVLVIERNAAPVGEPRAVSIDDESLRTMQAAGLDAAILPTLLPGYGSHYLGPDGRCFARVEPRERPYGYARRNGFHQPVLEARLLTGLARFPHVEIRFGWSFCAVVSTDHGVTATLRAPDGGLQTIAGTYLVGSDGAHSAVRRALGITLGGTSFDERWLVVDLEQVPSSTPHTVVYCDPRQPCIALPGPGLTRRLEFKLDADERAESVLDAGRLARRLTARLGAASAGARIRRAAVYRFHARIAEIWSRGRVYLAGDAAHLTPPFAGQGMNSGIRDAHNLAWKLASVLRGELGPRVLASYEQERRPHALRLIRLALNMGRVMSPRSRLSAWAIRTTLRLVAALPAGRGALAEMRFKPQPYFPRGFHVGKGGLIGSLFPQPMVSDASGRHQLLDAVIGDRFALICYSARPDLAFAQLPALPALLCHAPRIGILPPGAPRPVTTGCVLLRDDDDALRRWYRASGDRVLVLRPDHYVIAEIGCGGRGTDLAALYRLFERTWDMPARSCAA